MQQDPNDFLADSYYEGKHLVLHDGQASDALEVAKNIRDEDRAEVMASCGWSPEYALKHAYLSSLRPLSIVLGDEVIAVCGCVPYDLEGVSYGQIWLLGTPRVVTIKTAFLRYSRVAIDVMSEPFEIIGNCVDARNTVHIKWLKWLDFTFIREHNNFGYEQRKFYEFVRLV